MKNIIALLVLFGMISNTYSQKFPSDEENIPFLMTFGPKAETSWGDDDFSQIFFFSVPADHKDPIYIRIFDADTGGENDELNGEFDTRMVFSVYGGDDCYSDPDAQKTDPVGNYKSGNLMVTKYLAENPRYDNDWFTLGPFNPTEGENHEYFGKIIKLIIEGVQGDDGNMYRFFLSSSATENIPVEGGNAFAYEYSFRMHDDPNEVSHIYPYIDERTESVLQSNFDWDNDGFIRIVSVARRGQMTKVSNEDDWVEADLKVLDAEVNTSYDIQLHKKKSPVIKNNNVVIFVQNQYRENLKFVSIPIRGVPKYKPSINVK
jgi:hypothetical protein